MQFRIADTFQDSLAKLNNEEQKQAKLTAFDLQSNPATPSLKFHKLDRARDPNFWSLRVSRDIRIIVHKAASSLLLCYVDHHDDAYKWAERRKLEMHPKTGAAQIVEIRELVREIEVPVYVEQTKPASKPAVFARFTDDELLNYGVPPEWLADVRAADEDTILDIAEHLPAEAAEAVLEIATGKTPEVAPVTSEGNDPFAHPDAQRRFRVMSDTEELAMALDYPWDKWTTFLHPTQRKLVERSYNGPARISGTAGTGKTIVALHRAVWLVRKNPDARVLLTTFSDPLASALIEKVKCLIDGEPRLAERLEVKAMESVARSLYKTHYGQPKILPSNEISDKFTSSMNLNESGFSLPFVLSEWNDVIDARQISSRAEYKEAPRIGRKIRLSEDRRKALWDIFAPIVQEITDGSYVTETGIYHRLAKHYQRHGESPSGPYDYIIVDEAQDISISQLKWLAEMGNNNPDTLFFTGDLGQRIFQQAFSWKSCGVDIRGRSRSLRINYRTSHQIRQQADRLLDQTVSDADGNTDDRTGTISVFNGPTPSVQVFDDEKAEISAVADWLKQVVERGVKPHEIGVFVRSENEIKRADTAIELAGLETNRLDERVKTSKTKISLGTMHLAKGLEFRAVAVMACDDEVLPLQPRIDTVTDQNMLEDILSTERHLLYVACTRARDHLMVSCIDPPSEFLEDLEL